MVFLIPSDVTDTDMSFQLVRGIFSFDVKKFFLLFRFVPLVIDHNPGYKS